MTPLTPAMFHILLALAGGDRHGYGIMQDIAERTDGALQMGAGTLYGTIQRLIVSGISVAVAVAIWSAASMLPPMNGQMARSRRGSSGSSAWR